MAEQRPPDDEGPRVILTNPEWWKTTRSKGDLYVQITAKFGGAMGAVELTYRPFTPDAEPNFTQTFKSLDLARRALTTRGFRRVDQL